MARPVRKDRGYRGRGSQAVLAGAGPYASLLELVGRNRKQFLDEGQKQHDAGLPGFLLTPVEAAAIEHHDAAAQGAMQYWLTRSAVLQFVDPATLPAVYGSTGIPGNYTVVYRAIWQSPLFDLRKDLWAQGAESGGVYEIRKEALFSIRWTLQTQISGQGYLDLTSVATTRVSYLEFSHPTDPTLASFTMAPTDISTGFYAGNQSAQLLFEPIGPTRYWGVALVFDLLQPFGMPAPSLPRATSVYAALH